MFSFICTLSVRPSPDRLESSTHTACYLVLPRITTAKPLKFLSPALETISSAIESLSEHGAFLSVPPNDTGIESLSLQDVFGGAIDSINAVVKIIDSILEEGIWISSDKEQVRLCPSSLLFHVLIRREGCREARESATLYHRDST